MYVMICANVWYVCTCAFLLWSYGVHVRYVCMLCMCVCDVMRVSSVCTYVMDGCMLGMYVVYVCTLCYVCICVFVLSMYVCVYVGMLCMYLCMVFVYGM